MIVAKIIVCIVQIMNLAVLIGIAVDMYKVNKELDRQMEELDKEIEQYDKGEK